MWLVAMVTGAGLMYDGDTDDVVARAHHDVTALLLADLAVAGIVMVRALTGVQLVYVEGRLRAPSGDPLKETGRAFDRD